MEFFFSLLIGTPFYEDIDLDDEVASDANAKSRPALYKGHSPRQRNSISLFFQLFPYQVVEYIFLFEVDRPIEDID